MKSKHVCILYFKYKKVCYIFCHHKFKKMATYFDNPLFKLLMDRTNISEAEPSLEVVRLISKSIYVFHNVNQTLLFNLSMNLSFINTLRQIACCHDKRQTKISLLVK